MNSNISDAIVTLTNDLRISDENLPNGNSISTLSLNKPSENKVVQPDILTNEYSKGHKLLKDLIPRKLSCT